ncbi:hypothetical protein ACFVWN_16080 [Nocardiopsis flavescens]|uniref:hypothetical protein n=1 Tax=Nocardiopsis flavescens TaxID=758803 RepID=UPI003662FEDF
MSDLIDPSGFPVPKTLTYSLDLVAAKLKTDGTDLTDTTADITGAWGGLEGIYSAPEDQDLFTVLSPLTGDAEEVSTALSTTSDALSTFAETVRDIKARWATLKTESYAFLNKIEGDDDWRDGGGFLFWKSESPEVAEHNALLDRAAGLLHEYEEAERTCANAITVQFGGTTFIAQRADGSVTAGSGEYVYGFDAPLEGVPMEWGAPQTTDHAWYNDFGDAVGDFFVGIAEDVGGMVGAHGPNGWFSGNWGDNLWDYWGGTVEGLAGLVGVGKDENGEWGWSLETAGNAWKEAAHAVVPWEEWGDRPWYTIGTALLNVGAVVGGALLTATGVGAVVGVPLMAWRGAKILNSVGDSRTPDVPDLADFPGGIDPSLLSRIPRFGDGSFRPLDLSDIDGLDIDSADLGRMNAALERLNNADNGSGLPDGSDGRRTTDTGSDGENGSVPRGAANTNPEPEAENTGNRRNADSDETVDPTADQLDAGQEFLDGVDPESRRQLEEGLNGEQDRWVASQEVPDDASSLTDPDRVEVDGSGDGINARADSTVSNSVGGTTGPDIPRGGTAVVDLDSGSGRGGSTGGGFDGADGNGNGLPDGPDDLAPDRDAVPDRPDGTDAESPQREHVQRAGGSEADNNPRVNMEPGPGFYDADGNHIDVGHRDDTGTYFDDEGNRYVDVPESRRALEQYNEIRANDGDVDRISENTGYDSNVLDEIKQHLFFREHPDVPAPPDGRLRSGRFAAMDHIADLWRKAEAGTLDASEASHFRRLVAHEYVEARLMDEGVPYRSRDPQLWHDDYYVPTRDNNGAHDVSPLEGNPNNFALWEKWGIPEPEPGFRIADDMSNLDRVVDNALEWWTDRNPDGGYPDGQRPAGSAPGTAIDVDTDPGGSRSGGSGGEVRPEVYDTHPSTQINPDLGPDGTRTDVPDGDTANAGTGDTSNTDSGWTGERPKNGYGLSNEQRVRLADPYLRDLDMSSGRNFVQDFMDRVNNHPELLDIFYKEGNGSKWSADDVIGEYGIPKIEQLSDGTWRAKSDLPTPPKPDYLLPDKQELFPRRDGNADNAKLDLMAGVRRDEIDSSTRIREAMQTKKDENGWDDDHPEIVKLDEERNQVLGRISRAGEYYGEEVARSYVPEIFDGSRKVQVRSLDADGNVTLQEMTLPEIKGGDLLDKVETAPNSGNYQFDLVHATTDGGFVVTEAKADVQTELGDRKVGVGDSERRVSQGTEDYLRATLTDMIQRGKTDSRLSDKPFGSGYVNERELAMKMLTALMSDPSKLHYVELKGVSAPTGEHAGASFGLFDISPKRPGS